VAVVHWGYTDSVLLFDLDSLAVVLPFTEKQSVLGTESYKPYIERLGELTIVGENTSVNLEALLAYDPDLIIAGNAINAEITAELEKIATTVLLDEEKANIWGDWPSVVTAFGEILGQEDAAEKYIAEYRELLSTAKEKLAQVEGSVAFVQVREKVVWLQGPEYLKPYYEGLGLKAPDGEEASNGAEITLEGLSKLDPDHLFLGYFNYSDKSIPALTDEWDDSAVWSKLKSVQKDQLYAINGELALGYGPIGNTYGVNAVLAALDK
jgi:iron complex transport system substrate-binding protein